MSGALTPQYADRMRGSERQGENIAALPFSTCVHMIRYDEREFDKRVCFDDLWVACEGELCPKVASSDFSKAFG